MRLVPVLDCADPDLLSEFWTAALGYRTLPSQGPYRVLGPRGSSGMELVLQRVPEPKVVKNRMHIDIRTRDIEAETKRLISLGARLLRPEAIEEHGFRWFLLADPEDNEFCVCTERPLPEGRSKRGASSG